MTPDRTTPIPAEPCLVLLSLDMVWNGRVRRLYEFRKLEDFHAGDTFENVRYRIEEHTCPVNIRTGSMAFFIERSPMDYSGDPHGIWTVEGWITVAEALELGMKPNDGTEGSGYGVIQEVLNRFKEPPEDWQVELDMVPDPRGMVYMRFLTLLEERVKTIYNEGGESSKKLVDREIDNDRQKVFFNNSLNVLDRVEVLLEMAMVLKVDLNFMHLADYKAALPEACKDKQ